MLCTLTSLLICLACHDSVAYAGMMHPGPESLPHSTCADVQSQLNVAIERGDREFQLPSGGIDCSVDFLVLNAENLVLSGASDNSTTFWFDPRMAGFTVMNSRNVTVRNLAIDHNPLPYIQLDITKVTQNASRGPPAYEFQPGVRSLPLEKLDGSWGAMSQWWLWSGEGADRWVKSSPPFPLPKYSMFASSGDGGYKSLPGFPQLGNAVEGDSLTIMLRQYHTYTIGNSSTVTSEDITIYSSKGLNFYELDGEGRHIYRRVSNKRRDGQLIASNADCFHSIDVAAGPLIEDSDLGYCLDDFFVRDWHPCCTVLFSSSIFHPDTDQLQNIHNTMHVLLPANESAAGKGAPSSFTRAILVNPRIGVGSNTPDDAGENSSTLDRWYGDTSPMTNVKPGVDTLRCRTFARDVENGPNMLRLGGSVTIQKKTLVTDPARTSVAAKDALVKWLQEYANIQLVAVSKLEMYAQFERASYFKTASLSLDRTMLMNATENVDLCVFPSNVGGTDGILSSLVYAAGTQRPTQP